MSETPPKKRDEFRETPELKSRAPHSTRPPKKAPQPIGTPAEKGTGASLNHLHKATAREFASPVRPQLASPVRGDSAAQSLSFDPFHAHPVKHTFIHYDTPKKTVTLASPPKSVPSNFAPNRVVLLTAQGTQAGVHLHLPCCPPLPSSTTSGPAALQPPGATQTLRLSDYLPSPVIHGAAANQGGHGLAPMFPEFPCNQMIGVQGPGPVPGFPPVPPLPGPMNQCQGAMSMGGQMDVTCVAVPVTGQMVDMGPTFGTLQQQGPGCTPSLPLPMGGFLGDQACGQVCGVIMEEPITPQAQMNQMMTGQPGQHNSSLNPGGFGMPSTGPSLEMAPSGGMPLTSIWQPPGAKWSRRG